MSKEIEKKVYFSIDNGDASVTAELSGIIEMLKAEAEDVINRPNDIELYEWQIKPILLTEKEFENLPEAY